MTVSVSTCADHAIRFNEGPSFIFNSNSSEPGFKTRTRLLLILINLPSQIVSFRFSVDDQTGEFEYLWNPCFSFSVDYCQKAAVCQMVIEPSLRWFTLLATQDGVIEKNTRGLPELQLVGVDPNDQFTRKTLITLICDPTQTDNFTFQGEEPLLTYHFTLISKYACPTGLLTTTAPPQTTTAPPTSSPSPGPSPPIFFLATITILLAAILVCLCMLNCMVFMGLITRRPKQRGDNSTSGFTNHAFDKKPLN